ncbi:MAG: ABC-type transport system involved in multi-copper enzyme maturation, permease component [Actinomycetia bacterium]|nr:ABC-type transport system involved in multi-copper enzyme maturation, permease component [Actinomycetes bacterium]
MRSLRADLRTLRRPLTYWSMAIMALFGVLLMLAGVQNAHGDIASPGYRAAAQVTCADLGLPPGPACDRKISEFRSLTHAGVIQQQNDSRDRAVRAASADRGYLHPVQAGAMAAGLMASLPGAFIIALLAAGHIGGKWTRRTIKTQLLVDARRTRLLVCAWASTWLASLAVFAVTWIALAACGPMLQSAYHLPGHAPSLGQAWAATWPIAARAVLTMAVFAALGTAAAVVTRSTVGTLSLTLGVIMVSLIGGSLTTLSHATPAYWVATWTRFPAKTYVVTSYWNTFLAQGGAAPSWWVGLTGLLALLVSCIAGAGVLFRRQNVTV